MFHRLIQPFLCALSLSALFLASAAACAAPLQAVAVKTTDPGVVTVTVRATGAAPQPGAFRLRLLNGGATVKTIGAESVEAANELSPDLATAVLLLVDRSGSMRSAVPAIQTALKDVLARPRPDLRIAVMSFGSDTPGPTPYYSASAPVIAAIDSIRAETGHDGKTRLYDAINIGLSSLENLPLHGAKRLIVITDGKDEGSQTPVKTIDTLLQGRSQPMDAIAYGPAAHSSSDHLATLSRDSKGAFVLASGPPALADAIRADLGTAPAPAYDVNFRYARDATAPPLRSAQLAYAGATAGGQPTLMPIRADFPAPAKLPAPAVVHAQAASVASAASAVSGASVASAVTASNTVPSPAGASSPTWSWSAILQRGYAVIWGIRVTVKMGIGVLVALALLLAALAWRLYPKPPKPVVGPVETSSGPVVAPRQATRMSVLFPPPSPGRPAALLLNEGPRRASVSYAIEKTRVHVGAAENNDLVVHDDFVSRKHADIRFEGGSLYLTDLGSSNGTFLNGARLSRVMTLKPGDKIRFGHTTWEVLRADDRRSQPRSSGEEFEQPFP